MKRSKMIKDLIWWLNDQLYYEEITGKDGIIRQTDKYGEDCAEDLLEMLEDSGMLPPRHMVYQGPQDFEANNGDPYKSINAWEEE